MRSGQPDARRRSPGAVTGGHAGPPDASLGLAPSLAPVPPGPVLVRAYRMPYVTWTLMRTSISPVSIGVEAPAASALSAITLS